MNGVCGYRVSDDAKAEIREVTLITHGNHVYNPGASTILVVQF